MTLLDQIIVKLRQGKEVCWQSINPNEKRDLIALFRFNAFGWSFGNVTNIRLLDVNAKIHI